jgi:hypothetical protein
MSPARRAEAVMAFVVLALGTAGLVVASNLSFTAPRGDLVLRFGPSFNPLGAVVVIALAALAVAGASSNRQALVLAASGGFALLAIQVLLQFGRATNWLGSRGSNLSLSIAMAAGLAVLALRERRTQAH